MEEGFILYRKALGHSWLTTPNLAIQYMSPVPRVRATVWVWISDTTSYSGIRGVEVWMMAWLILNFHFHFLSSRHVTQSVASWPILRPQNSKGAEYKSAAEFWPDFPRKGRKGAKFLKCLVSFIFSLWKFWNPGIITNFCTSMASKISLILTKWY
jgi:hypothetical protein